MGVQILLRETYLPIDLTRAVEEGKELENRKKKNVKL